MSKSKPQKTVKTELFPDDCAALIARAITNFKGQGPELESAIGMLYVGHTFGWRVLYILHSVKTVEKYESILDIKVKERFQESTEHSERSLGYRVAGALSNFWRVVRGVDSVDGARDKGIAAS